MHIGKVIGKLWATRKEDRLSGLKLLIIQPINVRTDELDGAPLVGADIIGAGVGERVIFVSGSSARGAAGDSDIPVDATVVGIVDDLEIDRTLL